MNIHAIRAKIEDCPPTQQRVGRFMLRHGPDVPFLSVRKLAACSGVTPSTVMRLIKSLRIDSYNSLQTIFRKEFLGPSEVNTSPKESDHEHSSRVALGSVFGRQKREQLDRIARLIFQSPCHVAGFRSAYSLSHYLAYLLNMIQHNVFLVPNSESAAFDHLMLARPDHVLVIFSTHPYAAQSIKVAKMAKETGIRIVAVTDSSQSPLCALAHEVVVMDQISMNYIPTRISFFAWIEYLVETGCGLQDRRSRRELKHFRDQMEKLSGYWSPDDPVEGKQTGRWEGEV
ncbi:MAG: MurR/RpiR family transcriptional regulator [Litorivicinaceae bacterium]